MPPLNMLTDEKYPGYAYGSSKCCKRYFLDCIIPKINLIEKNPMMICYNIIKSLLVGGKSTLKSIIKVERGGTFSVLIIERYYVPLEVYK